MIVEFRFRNFRSFRDTQTLSFMATADTSHPTNVTAEPQVGNKKLVRAAVIYGANASGKSNVIEALHFLRDFVLNSGSRKPGEPIPVQSFLLDDTSVNEPSEFELTFIHDSIRYMYAISLDRVRVHREVLIAYPQGPPQTWFEREYDHEMQQAQYKFGARLHGEKKRLQSLTRDDVLFLSIAAQFNHPQLGGIYQYFALALLTINGGLGTEGPVLERMTARYSAESSKLRDGIVELLRLADLGIEDFVVGELDLAEGAISSLRSLLSQADVSPESQEEMLRNVSIDIRMLHKGRKDRGLTEFPIDSESLGTRRLFGLSSFWTLSLQAGTTLAIDELDDSLHPLLVRAMFNIFFDPKYNQKEAQLLFNTHDTTLLDTAILRRDQVWFVEKDREGASHLYPLSDFSARKDGALEKGYLRGRYGAIPFIDFSAGRNFFHAKVVE